MLIQELTRIFLPVPGIVKLSKGSESLPDTPYSEPPTMKKLLLCGYALLAGGCDKQPPAAKVRPIYPKVMRPPVSMVPLASS